MSNIYNMADTWNAAGTTFTAILMNVTNTASASGSLLMDLQISATSVFSVAKNGLITIAAGTGGGGSKAILSDSNFGIGYNGTGHFTAAPTGIFEFGSSGINSPDTGISRNAAGVVEINTATPGTFASLITKSVRGAAVTFANVPSPAVEGMMVSVTDSSTAIWGATITGSGANHVSAYYNGTNWTVAGK